MQSVLLDSGIGRGTLALLGEWRASVRDDYRDAEPGKILHELRRHELAALRLIPHPPEYGTADATLLYLMALHATWRATGDMDLLRSLIPVAEECLPWIDTDGDRDRNGFQE